MRLLDLFCGAGMASDGYASAGLDPKGIDITVQPDYPYRFSAGDALEFLAGANRWFYDAIHASPPCQAHTRAKHLRDAQGGESKHPDLLTPTLALLRSNWGHVPWVVENVPGAPFDPQPGEHLMTLCGSMFGLGVQRHRLFLTNWDPGQPPRCDHSTFPPDPVTGRPRSWGVYHVPGDSIPKGGRTARNAEHGRKVMGVTRPLPWASLKEGFPPAYTRWIGERLVARLKEVAA